MPRPRPARSSSRSASPASTEPSGGWDVNIWTRLTQTASANGITIDAAYYTDICGIPLEADGSGAINVDRTENLAVALQVNNFTHVLPGGTATAPDCPNRLVGPVAGVLVIGRKDVAAYVAGAIGIRSFQVNTRATAVAGYLQGYCDASEGKFCTLLPVAFPVNIITCDGSNKPLDTGEPWVFNTVYKIPLCSSASGNVGYIDWDPHAGGAGDVVCSIQTPDNPAIDLPSWNMSPRPATRTAAAARAARRSRRPCATTRARRSSRRSST